MGRDIISGQINTHSATNWTARVSVTLTRGLAMAEAAAKMAWSQPTQPLKYSSIIVLYKKVKVDGSLQYFGRINES